jgi:hypothetical protein
MPPYTMCKYYILLANISFYGIVKYQVFQEISLVKKWCLLIARICSMSTKLTYIQISNHNIIEYHVYEASV